MFSSNKQKGKNAVNSKQTEWDGRPRADSHSGPGNQGGQSVSKRGTMNDQAVNEQNEEELEGPETMLAKLEGLVKIQAIIRGFLTRKRSQFKPSK